MKDPIMEVARIDGRFSVEAYRFFFESLDEAINLAGKQAAEGLERHVTGQEVLAGLRASAEQAFGPLAAEVWRSWGIHTSLDWGRIVFILVDASLLGRRDEDSLEDFRQGFDFDQVFKHQYIVPIPKNLP